MKKETVAAKVTGFAHRHPWLTAAVGVVIALVIIGLSSGGGKTASDTAYYTVKEGDFLVTVVEGGNLEAVNQISIRNEVEGTSRIISIVSEGSYVKKGDLLVELDASGAQDQLNQQMINYEKASNALIQARAQYDIQKSTVESEVRATKLKVLFAEIDLKRYLEGQVTQDTRQAEIDIKNIEETLAINEERLKWSEQLYTEGFETKSNLDKDKLSVLQSQLNLEKATNALWMLQTYDIPKLTEQYQADVDEAKKELERVVAQGESRLAGSFADVQAQENTLKLNADKLARDQKQLEAAKLYAPQGGLVVYPVGEGRFSQESMIEEGATVRNRQELIRLPDTSQMKLGIKVHESQVTLVEPGQLAYIVLDAFPDKRFKGVVDKVGLLPDSQSRWGNPDLKVYATEVLVTDELPDVKPGVSGRAEIIITNIPNTIAVPIQAVTTLRGKQVAYRPDGKTSTPIPVEVGMYNTKFIQIVKGLESGDRVLLNPPFDNREADLGGAVVSDEEASSITNAPVRPARQPDMTQRSPTGQDPAAAMGAGPGAGGEANRGRGGPGGDPDRRAQMLKQFDKDGDGELNETERQAMIQEMQSRFGSRGQGQGGPGGRQGGGGRPPGGGQGQQTDASGN